MKPALLMSCVAYLLLAAAPSNPLPKCDSGDLLVSTGDGYACKQLKDLLERNRGSSARAEFLLPDCSSGQLLQSEGFGRWTCVDRPKPFPTCSSGETLRSEGSSGWSCERAPTLPQCSSGEFLVGAGGRDFRCEKGK